ncbi:hypothetical protein [Microbacterium elymi]|uniref:Uncharacterized protein n=1 Tax=Microbacterium elymi TaxID=2909587 RepID=A0ABY5NMD3_9MICO|nr:hypothetical protein [Microbacterium elymi]UUT36342.1 hypothetical protein L2X98_25715 [Microbacterium elymi]
MDDRRRDRAGDRSAGGGVLDRAGADPLAELLDRRHHEESIDVGGLDALAGIVVIGLLAIVLACTLSLIVTRRAVAPLVDALARQRRFVADASHELAHAAGRPRRAAAGARALSAARRSAAGHRRRACARTPAR